jgi:signal transduction histidine kinase/CheY-like chemotaxis protein
MFFGKNQHLLNWSAGLFIAALVLTVAAGYALYAANQLVMHTYRAAESLDHLSADLEALESDMRGGLLSGTAAASSATWLSPQKAAVLSDLTSVNNAVLETPAESFDAQQLNSTVQRELSFDDSVKNLVANDPRAALKLEGSPEEQSLLIRVSRVQDRMHKAELQMLGRRSGDLRRAECWSVLILACLAVSGAGLLLAFSARHRYLARLASNRADELAAANAELKDAQLKVSHLNTELQSHVKQLEIARDRALESSSLKSAFVANISHEIRTPLSGIIGMNELLLDSDLNPEQQALAATVQDSSMSLLTVLNDILDLSKIESGKLTLDVVPFSLQDVVDDAVRLMTAAAGAKGLKIYGNYDVRTPRSVAGDPDRVRQILLNLIGNAVKFTDHGSVTVQTLLVSETEKECVMRISVSDTGIGMTDDDRRHLFTPFSQLDNSTTRRFGGTGLGLAICKRLIVAMGGSIDVASKPAIGSTFMFTLPFSKAVKGEKINFVRKLKPCAQAHRCVLVVEDNPVLQQLAVMQLTNLGVSTRVARTGSEAIETVDSTWFDLILMDVHLPKMNGFECTQRIRELQERKQQKKSPIVAMTAGAMEGDREKCLSEGMDDYLSKPVSIETLRAMIDKWWAADSQAKSA